MEASEAPVLEFSRRPCAGHGDIFLIKLPEKGARRQRKWMFGRELEEILFGSDHHSSNLWHEIQELGLEDAARLVDSKSYRSHHLSKAEYTELLRIFNSYRRERDPLCGPAKKCTMIPVKLCATLAMARGHKELLITLGQPVPAEWLRLEQQAANAKEGCVDLALQEQIDEDDADLVEVHHIAIQAELLEFEQLQEAADDEAKFEGRSYALREQSATLQAQLASFRQYRTSVLNSSRQGKKVMEVTVCYHWPLPRNLPR